MAVDMSIAATVEDRLEAARDSLAARAGADVDGALESAAGLLEAHPELPNAAWLMAEVERARSTRFRRIAPVDAAAAARSWSRAAALDGGRAAGQGEGETAPDSGARAVLSVELRPQADMRIWADGAPLDGVPVTTRPGAHDVIVTWRGAPVWASWVELPPGGSTLPLSALDAPECSAADLSAVRADGQRVVALQARCPHWVAAATSATRGAVRIATCEADRCAALSDYKPTSRWLLERPEHPKPEWPAWATWGLVGTGAAVAAGVIAAVAVSNSQANSTGVRFVNGGLTVK
jgi:hypothetical protein